MCVQSGPLRSFWIELWGPYKYLHKWVSGVINLRIGFIAWYNSIYNARRGPPFGKPMDLGFFLGGEHPDVFLYAWETFGIKSALGVLDFRVLPSMAMSQNVGERPPNPPTEMASHCRRNSWSFEFRVLFLKMRHSYVGAVLQILVKSKI